jgi:hypothetical protein
MIDNNIKTELKDEVATNDKTISSYDVPNLTILESCIQDSLLPPMILGLPRHF